MSAVTEIRFVGYAVPDLETERAFYRDHWGLLEAAAQDGLLYFAAAGSAEPCVVRLRTAAEKRVDVIELAAGAQGARFLLLAGRPLREPIVQYGPFVMNTREQIEQALRDYQSGELTRAA